MEEAMSLIEAEWTLVKAHWPMVIELRDALIRIYR
jgi:hypothetical protein